MADAMLSISRKGLIEILTKSGRYNREGVETVLDNGGLACLLEAIMIDLDSETNKLQALRNKCDMIQDEITAIGFKVSEVQNDLIDICDDTDCDD